MSRARCPRVTHPFAAFSSGASTEVSSLDLHVLSTPPAFVLSQDQTLRRDLKLGKRTMTDHRSDRSNVCCRIYFSLYISLDLTKGDVSNEGPLIPICSPKGRPRLAGTLFSSQGANCRWTNKNAGPFEHRRATKLPGSYKAQVPSRPLPFSQVDESVCQRSAPQGSRTLPAPALSGQTSPKVANCSLRPGKTQQRHSTFPGPKRSGQGRCQSQNRTPPR